MFRPGRLNTGLIARALYVSQGKGGLAEYASLETRYPNAKIPRFLPHQSSDSPLDVRRYEDQWKVGMVIVFLDIGYRVADRAGEFAQRLFAERLIFYSDDLVAIKQLLDLLDRRRMLGIKANDTAAKAAIYISNQFHGDLFCSLKGSKKA